MQIVRQTLSLNNLAWELDLMQLNLFQITGTPNLE